MKVSVIVPVYNVSKYLQRGIESVLSQSYRDLELLLVDDGSTDESGRICDEYAARDCRIRVFHKENGGVASARNVGLDQATGEWVYFMDPDDELFPDCLSVLTSGISEGVDVVMGGYEEYRVDGKLIRAIKSSFEAVILDKSKSLKPLFAPYSPEFGYVGHACLRLYRLDIIRKNRIRFDETVSIREGTLFNATYLCRSRGTTFYIPRPVYRYYHRDTSAVGVLSKGFNRKYLTSFDSNMKVMHLIKNTDYLDSSILRCAKEEVMDRYRRIKRKMVAFGVRDDSVLQELRGRCIKELGIPFVAVYMIKWSRDKIRKKLWNS